MPSPRVLDPKPLLDEGMLLEEFERNNIKPQHAYTVWRYFLQRGVTSVRDIPGLPKAAYDVVENSFELTTSRVVKRTQSSDGSTTKLMVELQDGKLVESVVMRYGAVALAAFPKDRQRKGADGDREFRSNERATLCISSQVGCQMGCTFCATGTMGLVDNLTAGEILEQLYHANQIESIRNVVFMGMGEPLDNYNALITAIRFMTDVRLFSLSPSRITVSTVGVAPRLETLAHDAPGVSLALSLHAPNQELRSEIVPSATAWHIDRIMAAMDSFIQTQREREKEEGARMKKKQAQRRRAKITVVAEEDNPSEAGAPPPARFEGEDEADDVELSSSPATSATSSGRESTLSSLVTKGSYVLVEYVLIADINDSVELAHQLGELLTGRPVLLNVIPYNPTEVPYDYKPPSTEVVDAFMSTLRSHGIWTVLRQELGQDIDSACGQLVVSSMQGKKPKQPKKKAPAAGNDDIEDAAGAVRRRKGAATGPAGGKTATSAAQDKTGLAPAEASALAYLTRHWLLLVGLALILLVIWRKLVD